MVDVAQSLFGNINELYIKVKRTVCRNLANSARPIGRVCWTSQFSAPPDTHYLNPLHPTGNNARKRKDCGFTTGIGTVELATIGKCPSVVHFNKIVCRRPRTISRFYGLNEDP